MKLHLQPSRYFNGFPDSRRVALVELVCNPVRLDLGSARCALRLVLRDDGPSEEVNRGLNVRTRVTETQCQRTTFVSSGDVMTTNATHLLGQLVLLALSLRDRLSVIRRRVALSTASMPCKGKNQTR